MGTCRDHSKYGIGTCQWCGKSVCYGCIGKKLGEKKVFCRNCAGGEIGGMIEQRQREQIYHERQMQQQGPKRPRTQMQTYF